MLLMMMYRTSYFLQELLKAPPSCPFTAFTINPRRVLHLDLDNGLTDRVGINEFFHFSKGCMNLTSTLPGCLHEFRATSQKELCTSEYMCGLLSRQ